ncbi:hypothetical protein HCG49_01370 [Arenibacter sp. 6A1]|uniref:carboxypeptidase-like regulatory domain-containing protein n=1 Tax=Arenibacter sp. 6A1 TaxID=2720391 RepID=UPI0014485AA0|nr:carboxypeptidase-like regulatory domain-containing protein [Arenibacter sp. 6A1]NKI25209.1 hypothetical protein [Arenibacter sp. 6A1]
MSWYVQAAPYGHTKSGGNTNGKVFWMPNLKIGTTHHNNTFPSTITSVTHKEKAVKMESKLPKDSTIVFRVVNKQASYIPNKKHTLLVEISNRGEALLIPQLKMQLPEHWLLLSINTIKVIKKNETTQASLSFFIPSNAPVGEALVNLTLKNNIGVDLASLNIPLKIPYLINNSNFSSITDTVEHRETSNYENSDISFRVLNQQSTYSTNQRHSLDVEISNRGEALLIPQLKMQFPEHWQLLSINTLKVIKKNEKKQVSISFFIPSNSPSGETITNLTLKNNIGVPLASLKIPLEIAPHNNNSAYSQTAITAALEERPEKKERILPDNSDIDFRLVNKQQEYSTSKRHTLLVEISNRGQALVSPTLNMELPERWQLVSINTINTLKKNEKKLIFISFFIPSNAPAGEAIAYLTLKNNMDIAIESVKIPLIIAPNYALEVYNVEYPINVEAGELIKMSYAIKNIGNIDQNVLLSSKNNIKGPINMLLAPDTTVLVQLHQETDKKMNSIRSVYTRLEVYGVQSDTTYRAVKNVEVYPLKIAKEDPFFRFPIKTGFFYSSYTDKQEHYSTLSLEISGSGYLDLAKNHHLDFTFRGPRQEKIRRFGNADYYGITYKYKQDTQLFLGDHTHTFNRLGLNGKYGMGFVFDQEWEKWSLSAFYTKPRLYQIDGDALTGIKTSFFWNKYTTSGISLQRTIRSEVDLSTEDRSTVREKGFVLTFDMEYDKNDTNIELESSVSTTNRFMDVANYVNFGQRIGRFFYTGNITLTGINYFGTMNNSTQYYNSLSYGSQKWNFRAGHNLSKVNQRLDPLYYASEPYYENYFADIRFRNSKHHQLNLGASSRIKEDRLEPKNYHYREHGINYGYTFNHQTLNANFGGTLGRTQNLLSEDTDYRTTYNHNLGLGLRMYHHFGLRGKLSHNYSNRYGYDNTISNYYRYSLGFNGKIGRKVNFSANFNSGFSPEETYLKRDYINLSAMARIHKNHQLEVLMNYFENPGVVGNAEILAYAKYTLTLGVPLKRVLKQGGVAGTISTTDPDIPTKGIKIIATGKTLLTDKNGQFEINNLPLGKNFILVDQTTLPQNVITLSKNPHEVFIEHKNKIHLDIQLIRAASISGHLSLDLSEGKTGEYLLNGYIKLENADLTLYTESDKDGKFEFHRLPPGTYAVSLVRLREQDNEFSDNRSIQVTVASGETQEAEIVLKLKERKIKFQNKRFNLKRE